MKNITMAVLASAVAYQACGPEFMVAPPEPPTDAGEEVSRDPDSGNPDQEDSGSIDPVTDASAGGAVHVYDASTDVKQSFEDASDNWAPLLDAMVDVLELDAGHDAQADADAAYPDSSTGGVTGTGGVSGTGGAAGSGGNGGTGGDAGIGIDAGTGGTSGSGGTSGAGGTGGTSGTGGTAGAGGTSGTGGTSGSGGTSGAGGSPPIEPECDVTGLRVTWAPTTLTDTQTIEWVHARIGTLPLNYNVCGPDDDLNPDPHIYTCCIRTDTSSALKGSHLYLDFALQDGQRACGSSGCPLPYSQFEIALDSVPTPSGSFNIIREFCSGSTGVCQWILDITL